MRMPESFETSGLDGRISFVWFSEMMLLSPFFSFLGDA